MNDPGSNQNVDGYFSQGYSDQPQQYDYLPDDEWLIPSYLMNAQSEQDFRVWRPGQSLGQFLNGDCAVKR